MIQLKHLLSESDNLDTSKIRIKTSIVNGLLVFIPFYDRERMGAFRLRPYGNNYQIDSVLLYDRFKGIGIGKGMYKFIIKYLAKQDKKLYSDNLQSADAEHIWNSLVASGLAAALDGNKFVSKV